MSGRIVKRFSVVVEMLPGADWRRVQDRIADAVEAAIGNQTHVVVKIGEVEAEDAD